MLSKWLSVFSLPLMNSFYKTKAFSSCKCFHTSLEIKNIYFSSDYLILTDGIGTDFSFARGAADVVSGTVKIGITVAVCCITTRLHQLLWWRAAHHVVLVLPRCNNRTICVISRTICVISVFLFILIQICSGLYYLWGI